MTRVRIVPALALLALLLCQGHAAAETPAGETVFRQALKGAALILVRDNGKIVPSGTGWVVDARQRLIVTNYHVVPNLDVAYVKFPLCEGGRVISDPDRYSEVPARPGRVIDSNIGLDL